MKEKLDLKKLVKNLFVAFMIIQPILDIYMSLFDKKLQIVGVSLALINGLRIFVQYKNLQLACTVGLSITVTVILSKSIGCLLPLLAKKLKLDPAIMAAPLITTIVDILSVLVYFNIATAIMGL